MVFDYSTDAVYPSMVYTSRRLLGDSLMDGAGIFLVQGGDREFPGAGEIHRHLARFKQLDVGLFGSRPSTPYIRELGTAIGSAEYIDCR